MDLFDINNLRAVTTVLSFGMFLAIIAWTFMRKNRQGFDEAAALPFSDEPVAKTSAGGTHE